MKNKRILIDVVGSGVAWMTVSTAALKIIGIVTMIFTLRNLTVFEYGVAELVQSILPIMGIFLLPGLSTVVVADMGIARSGGDFAKMKGLFRAYCRLSILLGCIAWAILFLVSVALMMYYSADIGLYYAIISFALLIGPARSLILAYFSVMLRFREQALLVSVEEVVKLIIVVVASLINDLTITWYLIAIVASQGAATAIFMPIFLKHYRLSLGQYVAESIPMFAFLYHHGKWGIAANYLSGIGQSVRAWLIKWSLGTEAVGLFSVAVGLIGHTRSLMPLSNIVAPLIPQFVSEKLKFYRIIQASIKYSSVGFAILAVVAAIAFPPVLGVLFPQYTASFVLYQILLISLVPTAFGNVFNQVFFALQAQRNLFLSMIYRLLASIVLLPVLAHLFGLYGVAIEFVLIIVLFAFERYRVLKKLLPDFTVSIRDLVRVTDEDRFVFGRISLRLRKAFVR